MLQLLGVGFVAGIAGGMLGIGGGLVMIPALLLLRGELDGQNAMHIYKLAAITTSIAVVLPAAMRHDRSGALQRPRVARMRWSATVGILVGVAISMLFTGTLTALLRRLFGVFVVAVVVFQVLQRRGNDRNESDDSPNEDLPKDPATEDISAERRLATITGGPAGFLAGFFGVGGGVWGVPAQHIGFHIPLRNAIANSTALIAWIAPLNTVVQGIAVALLPGSPIGTAFLYAGLLIPSALLGGWIGAGLTHRLPIAWIRTAFFALLFVAGLRLVFG